MFSWDTIHSTHECTWTSLVHTISCVGSGMVPIMKPPGHAFAELFDCSTFKNHQLFANGNADS